MTEPVKFIDERPFMYEVVHDVAENHPDNFAGRDVKAGETFFKFIGNNYNSDPIPGRALVSKAGPTVYPFFEFPLSALTKYDPHATEVLPRLEQ